MSISKAKFDAPASVKNLCPSSSKRERRKFLLSAQIVGVHGVQGALKVRRLGNDEAAFLALKKAHLLDAQERYLRPVSLRHGGQGKSALVWMDGLDKREAAEALRGYYLAIDREEAAPLPEGRYYVCDLLGLQVFQLLEEARDVQPLSAEAVDAKDVSDASAGQIRFLGILKEILQNTCQDVYVVRREGRKDLLFPLVNDCLQEVNLDKGYLLVKLPEGLLEIYDD